MRAASGRKRYNVLGALDAVTHRLIRVTNDGSINAESVCALLRAVAEAAVGLPITLVLDNARVAVHTPKADVQYTRSVRETTRIMGRIALR